MLVSRLWEERRLAYPIAGHRKGTYWLMYFRSPTSILTPLNRQCDIHDGDPAATGLENPPHLVEAVLEHAKAGPAEARPLRPRRQRLDGRSEAAAEGTKA